MILLILSGIASAATLTVDPDDPSAYETIQEAIDDATTGDTITVVEGDFDECVDTAGKDLTIKGAGSALTKVDGRSCVVATVTIQGGETVVLEDLELTNINYNGVKALDSEVTLTRVLIDGAGNSYYVSGGGVSVSGGSLTIADSTIDDTTGKYGGGLYASDGAVVAVSGSTFTDCTSWYGGAIYGEAGESGVAPVITVTSSTFEDNDGYYGGGAFYAGSEVDLHSEGNTFEGNVAGYGWGQAVYGAEGSFVTVVDDLFDDNAETYGYGQLTAMEGATLEVSGATFKDGYGYYGGGIYLEGATATVTGSTFEGNTAYYGGAIYALDSILSVSSSTFVDNAGNYAGGAVYLNGTSLSADSSSFTDNFGDGYGGGAIYAYSGSPVVLEDVDFEGNLATVTTYGYGGAIYSNTDSPVTANGGSFTNNVASYNGGAVYIYLANDTSRFEGTTFSGNDSMLSSGGAVQTYYYSDLELVGVVATGNSSEGYGGAIATSSYSSTLIEDSVFRNNEARLYDGGAVSAYPYEAASSWEVLVQDSEFTDNVSGRYGGGFSIQYGGQATVHGNTVVGNVSSAVETGTYGGGGYIYYMTKVAVTNNLFCGNESDYGGALMSYYNQGSEVYTNNVFMENAAWERGGGLYLYASTTEVVNNTFVGNEAYDGGGLYSYYVTGDFINNIVAYSVGGDGIFGADYYADSTLNRSYNAFYDNEDVDAGGYYTIDIGVDGNIDDAPDFFGYSLDGDCSNDLLGLRSTSALIDAGHPDIEDPDGSRSDIGAYGGPGADAPDEDGDGFPASSDCDDSNADIFPGAEELCDGQDNDCDGTIDVDASDAPTWYSDGDGDGEGTADSTLEDCDQPEDYVDNALDCDDSDPDISTQATEIPYDGVDQDCDGVDLTDVDGDGYDAIEAQGDDCDDNNAAINPGAVDIPGDDIDQDCDGKDAIQTEGDLSGCGCSAAPSGRAGFAPLLALLALVGLRRRRS